MTTLTEYAEAAEQLKRWHRVLVLDEKDPSKWAWRTPEMKAAWEAINALAEGKVLVPDERSPAENAAISWWESKRPVTWSVPEHISTPSVNCVTPWETDLAREVSAMIAEATQGDQT